MATIKYNYKDKQYNSIYDLSEAMGHEGVFIPLSLSDESLADLGVTVMREEEPIETLRERKIMELKRQRDTAEVEPIEYNGHSFDYDDKARDRINAAIIALELQGEGATIDWTTADTTNVLVTAKDLRNIIAAVALRSNDLHIKYRELKEQVLACSTAVEVEEIAW